MKKLTSLRDKKVLKASHFILENCEEAELEKKHDCFQYMATDRLWSPKPKNKSPADVKLCEKLNQMFFMCHWII